MSNATAKQFDVFLSHNSREKPDVELLARKLRRSGLPPWLDIWCIEAGKPWVDELAKGLAASSACAFFVGPHDIGDWAREEYYFAQDRAAKDHDFRLFPVLLPGLPDPFDFNALPPFLRMRTAIDFRSNIDDDRSFQMFLRATSGLPLGAEEEVEDRDHDICPYRGLEVFDEEHAGFLFGRDADIQHLKEKLKQSRFLAVLGPSGTGKSSVVRAGLIPALRAGGLPKSQTWTIRVFTPTAAPITTLAAQISQLSPHEGMQKTVDLLRGDERTLHLAAALALTDRQPQERILWVIDQFEELFTLCHDEEERTQFLANLVYAASVPGGRNLVVLTLRADFYPKCAAYPGLAQQLAAQQYLVGPLERDGLQKVITEPAWEVGLEFEPGLVETILDDVQSQPGALPLLEFALLELWKRRRGNVLSLAGYQEAGGVQSALATTADAVYAQFAPDEQDIARRILLRLTQPGDGTEDTRRRTTYEELIIATSAPEVVDDVVGKLVRERLLTTSSDPSEHERWVDVSHEALIRGWPMLQQWIDQDRAGLRELRRLTEAVHEWQRHGNDEGYLYRGANLATAVEWRHAHDATLNELEEAFLWASATLREREQETERRRQQQQLEAARAVAVAEAQTQRERAETERERAEKAQAVTASERRRLRAVHRFTAGLVSLLLVMGIIAYIALQARSAADAEKLAARTSQLIQSASAELQTNPELGLLLATEDVKLSDTPATEAVLRQALVNSNERAELRDGAGATTGLSLSPDGRYAATASIDGKVRVWNWRTRRLLVVLKKPKISFSTAVFSRDGQYIATTNNNTDSESDAWIWKWRTRQLLADLPSGGWQTTSVAFSPDGTYLATGNDQGVLDVWKWRRHSEGASFGGNFSAANAVRAVTFSPDGNRVVVAGFDGIDGYAQVLNWRNGNAVVTLHEPGSGTLDAAFSPDGRYVVTANTDSTARVWNWQTRKSVATLRGHIAGITTAAFSADGNLVVTASFDKTARIWDWRSGSTIAVLRGDSEPLTGAVFTPDGRFVLTASYDGTTRLWQVPSLLLGHSAHVLSAAFSLGSRYVVTASGDHTVRVWNWRTGRTLATFKALCEMVPDDFSGATFSPDGKHVLVASQCNPARVWDWHGNRLTSTLGSPYNSAAGPLSDSDNSTAAGFSPNGNYVVTVDHGNQIQVWNWRRAQKLTSLKALKGSGNYITAVEFAPDGQHIVAASANGTIGIWRWRTKDPVTIMKEAGDAIITAAFSPDGKYVAVGTEEGTIHIWEWQDRRIVSTLTASLDAITSVSFSPDGNTVLSASYDGAARVWDWRARIQLVTFGDHAGAANDAAFSPDGKLIATARDDRTVRINDWSELRPGVNLLQLAASRATRQLTPQEKTEFIP